MQKLRQCILCLCLCVVCAGCAHTRSVPRNGLDIAAGRTSYIKHVPSDISDKINAANCAFESLQTAYALQTEGNPSGVRSFSCSGSLAVISQNTLRMYGKTPLAGKLFDILVKDNSFFVYLPKQNKLIRGSNRFPEDGMPTGVALPPQAVLKGIVHQPFELNHDYYFELEPHFFVAYLVREHNGIKFLDQKLWINNTTYIIEKKQVFDQNGSLAFDVQYTEFHDFAEKGVFPKEMDIVSKVTHETIRLKFSKVKINAALSDTMFELETPANIDVITME